MHGKLSEAQVYVVISLEKVPGITTVCVDIEDVKATTEAVEALGTVDLLVNNAAIALLESFLTAKVEDFDKYVSP